MGVKEFLKALSTVLWTYSKDAKKTKGATVQWTKLPADDPEGAWIAVGDVGSLIPDLSPLKLKLKRKWFTNKSTVGELSVDGKFECFILEDYDRLAKGHKKVHGETAIPGGTYRVDITYSPRFKRKLPVLKDVPEFRGIRIHAGNTAKDTEGCLLPGQARSKNFVGRSKLAFNALFKKLEEAKHSERRITIEVD